MKTCKTHEASKLEETLGKFHCLSRYCLQKS